jgi:hypothetical protein
MSSKFLKFLVIFLAILILFCFIFLLYGLYSKISNSQSLSITKTSSYSLNLKESENIKDVRIINENNILLVISDDDHQYLIIYNLKEHKIVLKIGR